ncbi:MAG TPA: ATP-binding protein [Gemmatimonadaceae bacterium]|nr:ATP-binding protein [Gemmatimonadaceae bacterium]
MSNAPPPLESGAVLRVLAGAISDVVVVLDRDGRYLDVVSRRAELLVRPADELLGRRIHDVFPRANADAFVRWINQALDGNRTVEDEYEVDIAGKRTWFAAIVTPLTPATVVWIARDITERKMLEAQLRQSAKMEAVGRLAGGVAHDFNNLLTAISTNADLALGALRNDQEVEEEIGQIKRAAERAAALTRQLLAFSRKQMLQPRVLHMNDAVREAGELLERLIGEDVELVTHLDPDTWPVVADAGQLTQVVMNLAVNGRDAMPNGGVLVVTTGNIDVTEALAARQRGLKPGPYAVLTMRDTGTGMDRKTQDRVFEPFFTTKEQGKGTGLGLATVYGIVKQSGGYIQLASEPGRGTTFWIFLPRANDAVSAPVKVSARTSMSVARGTTVLIVEDEAQVRGAAARVLRRYGYTVLEAQNGIDALALWAERGQDIAVVVTDVVMPQLGGRELVRRLRADGATVPVLFISGYAEGATPERGDDTGQSVFLAKPFEIAVFVRLVGELIQGAPNVGTANH